MLKVAQRSLLAKGFIATVKFHSTEIDKAPLYKIPMIETRNGSLDRVSSSSLGGIDFK